MLALKKELRLFLVGSIADRLVQRLTDNRELAAWKRSGRSSPPPHSIKRTILSAYASAFKTDTLVETGTYLGQMVHAMKGQFQAVWSMGSVQELAANAKRRFGAHPHIEILQGDSGELLPVLLNRLSRPALFWLDGHYSAGITAKGKTSTPIMAEVAAILQHGVQNHVMLIDDARCSDGTHDYPTLRELQEMVERRRPGLTFSVANDVIRIHPPKPVQCEF